MPTKFDRKLDAPEGHANGTITEWDYDRAGGAYLITCECGWSGHRHYDWTSAVKEHGEHVKWVQRIVDAAALTNDELAEKLNEYVRHSMSGQFGWGHEWLREAAARLAR